MSLIPTNLNWLKIRSHSKKISRIFKSSQLVNLKDNLFVGNLPKMIKSEIIFSGHNNILYCEKNVRIENSILRFNGDNSIIYLGESGHHYKVDISIHNNSVVHIGSNNYFNTVCRMICSENKHIFIGDSNLFSINVFFRNADPHLIYDVKTKHRINLTKSIYIGDHVWIGQNCMLLKGSKLYSGSILGAGGISTKEMMSNSIYVGVPAKCVKKDIFWQGECVHEWTDAETKKHEKSDINDFIYNDNSDEYISFEQIDSELDKSNVQEKLQYLQTLNAYKKRIDLVKGRIIKVYFNSWLLDFFNIFNQISALESAPVVKTASLKSGFDVYETEAQRGQF